MRYHSTMRAYASYNMHSIEFLANESKGYSYVNPGTSCLLVQTKPKPKKRKAHPARQILQCAGVS